MHRHNNAPSAAIRLALCPAVFALGISASAESAPADPPPRASADCAGATSALDLEAWVNRADPSARRDGNTWELLSHGREMLLVFDETAGRMRLMTPVADVKSLSTAVVERALQANFDTALDARYAIAHGLVWSVFIHPLPTLSERDFALRQVAAAAQSFGSTFSSGELYFQGGDSEPPATPPAERPQGDEESI